MFNLQKIWEALQEEENDVKQQSILNSEFYPQFTKICTRGNSVEFRRIFGDGKALANVLCTMFTRDSTAGICRGLEGVSSVLDAPSHTKLLSLISTLINPEFHGSNNTHTSASTTNTTTQNETHSGSLEGILRVIVAHGIPSIIVSLHNSFLGMLSTDPLHLVNVSPDVVAAEKMHLSLLSQFITHEDNATLSDINQCNGFLSIVTTLSVCYTYPFASSSSLTGLAVEIVQTCLANPYLVDAVASPTSVINNAELALLECMADDAKKGDYCNDINENEDDCGAEKQPFALQIQKLSSLSHCLDAIFELRAASNNVESCSALPLQLGAVVTSMLSLQQVMSMQRRITEGVFDAFLRFSFKMEYVASNSREKEKKKKGFFTSAFSKFLLNKDKHEKIIYEKKFLFSDAESLQAAASFIVSANAKYPEPRLWLLTKLSKILCSGDPNPICITSVADTLCNKVHNYDLSLISELLKMIESISTLSDISSPLSKLSNGIISLGTVGQNMIIASYITLAHRGPPMVDTVAECGVIKASCTVIEKLSQDITKITIDDSFLADAIYCMWKVLLQSPSALDSFNNSNAIRNVFACCTLSHYNTNECIMNCIVSSRNALVSLITSHPEQVGIIVEAILKEKGEWSLRMTPLLVTFVMVLFGTNCHEHAISRNGIEVCLSLLHSVDESTFFSFDMYLIATALSLLMSHVRWSACSHMLASAIPASIYNKEEVYRFLVIVACGFGMAAENMTLLIEAAHTMTPPYEDPSIVFVRMLLDSPSCNLLCEQFQALLILCKRYNDVNVISESSKKALKETIYKLAKAYRSPIIDSEFAITVVKNEWWELLSLLGEFKSIEADFSCTKDSNSIKNNSKIVNNSNNNSSSNDFLTPEIVQITVEKWKGAVLATNNKIISLGAPPRIAVSDDSNERYGLTFCGCGGVSGSVAIASGNWPPIPGFSVAGWFSWSKDVNPHGGGNTSLHVCLWSLRWDYGPGTGKDSTIRVRVDTDLQVTLMQIDSLVFSGMFTFPVIPPDEWYHVTFVFNRITGECSMYLNGACVQQSPITYPIIAVMAQGGFMSSSSVDVTIGFTPSHIVKKMSLSVSTFAMFDGILTHEMVDNLAAASLGSVNAPIVSSAGQCYLSLGAPVLNSFILNRLAVINIDVIVQEEGIRMKMPELKAILSVHPMNILDVDQSLRYLDNKAWAMVNDATTSKEFLNVYGRHSTLPMVSCEPAMFLCTHVGTQEWFKWFMVPDLPSEVVQGVLEVMAACYQHCTDIIEFSEREHYYKFATIVSSKGTMFTADPTTLRKLLRLAFRPRRREMTMPTKEITNNLSVINNFAATHTACAVRDAQTCIVVNGPLTELLFLNWNFLGNISCEATLMILRSIAMLMAPGNPYAAINAWRLKFFGFIDGFLYGMLRHYVPLEVMSEVRNIVDSFVRCKANDATTIAELITFVIASSPVGGDESALVAKLSSSLHPQCYRQFHYARNIVLSSFITNLNLIDFTSLAPLSWFQLLTDRRSHPVTVTLVLSIFATLYNSNTAFRVKCEKCLILRTLARNLQYHAHQPDVISIVTSLLLGTTRDVFVISATPIDESKRMLATHIGVLPLVVQLAKNIALSLTNKRAPTTLCSRYFSSMNNVHLPNKLRVVLLVVCSAIRFCNTTTKKSKDASSLVNNDSYTSLAVSSTSVVNSPRRRSQPSITRDSFCSSCPGSISHFGSVFASSYNTPVGDERGGRIDLCLRVLDFIKELASRQEVVLSALYSQSNTVNLIDSLSWVALSCMKNAEDLSVTAPDVHSFSPLANDRDNISASSDLIDIEPDAVTPTSAADINDLSLPLFPELLAGVMDLYCGIQELHAGRFASVHANNATTKLEFVCLLNQIVSSVPNGVGDQTQAWFQTQIIHTWLENMLRIMRRTPAVGDIWQTLFKNSFGTAIYVTERLIAGLPAPPHTSAYFIASLTDLSTNTETVKMLKALFVEWALFILSGTFHNWVPRRMATSRKLIQDFKPFLLSQPFSSSDTVKIFLRALLEISLVLVHDSDTVHKDVVCLDIADIWFSFFAANRSLPVFFSLLIDGGGNTGRPRIDLFHGGFDLLYLPIGASETFLDWFVENRALISEVLSHNPNMKIETKFSICNPRRFLKWVLKAQEDIAQERGSNECKTDEFCQQLTNYWDKFAFTGSSVDANLLLLRLGNNHTLKDCVIRDPPTGAVHMYLHRSGVVNARQYGTDKQAFCYDLETGAVPLGAIISHAGSGCVPFIPPEIYEATAATTQLLKPSAQLLLAKVLESDFVERRDTKVQWIGNIYNIVGNESLICIMIITRLEIVLISSAQVSSDGEVFITSLETHNAAKQAQTRNIMQNVIRRFLPRAPIPAGLAAASLATFRHSQYYRQLRTEALSKQDDSRIWRFPLSFLSEVHHRYFQHQPAALECVLEDGTRHMFVLLDKDMVMSRETRQVVAGIISELTPHVVVDSSVIKRNRLMLLQKRWLKRTLSTFEYILAVNDAASRTVTDFTQYPVMPWVLSEYEEVHVPLDNIKYFRDFSKPLGALNSQRREEVTERFQQWIDDATPPFHYGTHYSTSAVVLYYLIRLQPMTQYSIAYQGGKLDVPDRLFHSVAEAWSSCSSATGRDVKELIPEFFRLPAFLLNSNQISLGTRRDGVSLNNVVLPPWACGDIERFILINREALESDCASEYIHLWIDLVFGYRQCGNDAIEACNVFHHLSYSEGLENAMTNAACEEDRKAIVASVDNFGLTPKNVFKTAHPKRSAALNPQKQQIFLAATAQLIRKATPFTACEVRCGGQPVVNIVEADGFFISSELYRTTSVKPLQYFVLGGHRIVLRRMKDNGASLLPDYKLCGAGEMTSFATCPTGNIVYCGTSHGKIIVMARSSWCSLHLIAHVLHNQNNSAVHRIVPLKNGCIAALSKTNSLMTIWQVTRRGASLCFSFKVNTALIDDTSALRDVTEITSSGQIVCVKERSIFVVSQQGTIQAASASIMKPFTCIAVMNFTGHSATQVIVCGHEDGNISFWALKTNIETTNASPFSLALHSHVAAERAAITCILPQPNIFGMIAGCANGAVWTVCLPAQAGLDID